MQINEVKKLQQERKDKQERAIEMPVGQFDQDAYLHQRMYSFDFVQSDKTSALNFISTTHVSEQSSTQSQPLPIKFPISSTPGMSCDLPPVQTESLSTPKSYKSIISVGLCKVTPTLFTSLGSSQTSVVEKMLSIPDVATPKGQIIKLWLEFLQT